MECLQKRWQDFQLKVRRFVDRNWHNDPEGDVFRSLDVMLVLGAIRYNPTNKWQRIVWNTYRIVSVLVFSIVALNLVDAMSDKFDVVKIVWHATIFLTMAPCFLKDLILNNHLGSIQTARNFINSKPFGSGDAVNDSSCRKKVFQRIQSTMLVFFVIVLTDEFVYTFPNSGIKELFKIPRICLHLGPDLVQGIYILFLYSICPIWFNKYAAGTGTVCSLLYGFKTEHEIFVRGFGNILDNVYRDVEEQLPSDLKAAPDWMRYQRDKLFWKYLKQHVTDQVKMHVQLAENMQLLQPIVKYLFAVIYYDAMVLFSPLFYVMLFNGLSLTSIAMASGVAVNLLECYGWCRIIDYHQDINDTFEIKIMDLVTKIPHSKIHHKEYVEIRSTLCIMKTFTRNSQRFSCGGVFPINVEAFTGLLNIGYTVLTFLRDIGKKQNQRVKKISALSNRKH